MSHQSRRLNTSYRRNGKLQSCEPCRKGKLRCDHMMPTCGRCTRRNRPEQCIYHPAPLTKANGLATPQTTETDDSTPSVVHSYEYDPAPLSPLPFSPFNEPPIQPRALRASSLPSQPWSSTIYGQQTVEELRRPLPDTQVRGDSINHQQMPGFVHHSAVLAENELSIGILPPNSDLAPAYKIPQSHIDRGATILSLFKELPLFQRYIEKWFSFSKGIIVIEPMMKIWLSGVWSAWHKVLEAQNTSSLRQMSEKIWENTMKPLHTLFNGNTKPRDFCAMTTGEGLRWEIVGIILTIVSLLAQSLQDGDPIFSSHDEPPVDRAALALKTFNGSEMCLTFCTDFDILNDIVLWFLLENTVAYCSLRARGSYANWQKAGQLTTALLYFGLHQEIKADESTPFFITEFRKRLFVCAYDNDKYSAEFIGRPPRFTRHYCRLHLPLDLTDAQIMSDGLDLENHIAGLDDEGWNQRGIVQRCTFERVFATGSLILEEILEISLGCLPSEEIIQRATDIEARVIRYWMNIPSFLRIDETQPLDMKRAPVELLFLAYIKLAEFGHHFLLQRTLIKKVGADSTKLLAVSKRMFDFVMVLINNRDFLRDFQLDFMQIQCMNGIPAAAVIAVELLHQEQNPSSTSATTSPLPRSDTIQALSVFVACLGSRHPNLARGRKFLRKILDTILSPTPSIAVGGNSSVGGMGEASFTTPLFQTGNDGDFMRWLETMEWEQESWVNFS